jgi:hypothetical protein
MSNLRTRLTRQERIRLDPARPPSGVRQAIARMEARLEIRWIEWDRDWRELLEWEHENPTIEGFTPPDVPVVPPDEGVRYERAQSVVGKDTPAVEARDQSIIRRWEIRCYGAPGPLNTRWGGDWFGKSWPAPQTE